MGDFQMKNRAALVLITAIITVGTILSTTNINLVSANTSLEKRIQDIQQESSTNQQEAKKREADLAQVEIQMKKIEDEIREVDLRMGETHNNIRRKKVEIEEVREHIEELQEELRILEIRIVERDELLRDRARSMYQNGGSVNYLEVILGAKSFGDFLDRLSALTMIAQQDRSILEAHIEDQLMAEETKALVEAQLATLESHLVELERLMATLEVQKQEKDSIMVRLVALEQNLHAELGELEDAAGVLASQEQAMKAELAAWKEREKQLEIERKKELERQRQQNKTNRSTNATASTTTTTISGSGILLRPAAGRISSHYGSRVHPVYGTARTHHGTDIANSTGTPIHASEAGTVIAARYMSGYGNTVLISHNVDGQVLTTLYAHLNTLQISNGARVSRGQQIGTMGATGTATGPHLHFEVHQGPWNASKSNSVNPLNYIPR
jgi:peptidoglycan hydrolase CwlO-like protein